jgi:hypothetical protein
MGKMDELIKKIEDAKKKDVQKKIDIEKSKKEWLKSLFDLFMEIKTWMFPLINKKLVSLEEKIIVIKEDLFGAYDAPMLEINGPEWKILLKPKGRFIVGAKGRIDVICGTKELMFVLHDKGWELAVKKERGFKYLSLDSDLFAEIIEELTL